MVNRGFGIEVEGTYGSPSVSTGNFDPDWWNRADSVDFKLNDEPVTRSGGSRMNKRARAGVMKPTGSTSADADLQQLACTSEDSWTITFTHQEALALQYTPMSFTAEKARNCQASVESLSTTC